MNKTAEILTHEILKSEKKSDSKNLKSGSWKVASLDMESLYCKYLFRSILKEYYTPNQKLACSVLYFKILNTFSEKWLIYASYSKLSKEVKK